MARTRRIRMLSKLLYLLGPDWQLPFAKALWRTMDIYKHSFGKHIDFNKVKAQLIKDYQDLRDNMLLDDMSEKSPEKEKNLINIKMKTIQYGIDTTTGLVWSRVGSEVAVPVLQYDKMTPENNFNTVYELEKMDVIHTAGHAYNSVIWTRKIPTEIKNRHRKFWGMKSLDKK